jgi:hypothetical protein
VVALTDGDGARRDKERMRKGQEPDGLFGEHVEGRDVSPDGVALVASGIANGTPSLPVEYSLLL